MKRFLIEGEHFSHKEILTANEEAFTREDIHELAQLKVGESLYVGFIKITRTQKGATNENQ